MEQTQHNPSYSQKSRQRRTHKIHRALSSTLNCMTKVELSVVMPCLNEAGTVGVCIEKIQRSFKTHNICGEVVVADNGSDDGSLQVADSLGARIIPAADRGYGSALMAGINAAHGKYVIMGDADDSYDFSQIPVFLEKLRSGYDLVQGCRLPSGGGQILPRAMPITHRYIGNPLFSILVKNLHKVPIHDPYCGLRGFTRHLYRRLDLRCNGMQFAVEIVLKAYQAGANITELPITLHPDGRDGRGSHLKTWRDGWKTLNLIIRHSKAA